MRRPTSAATPAAVEPEQRCGRNHFLHFNDLSANMQDERYHQVLITDEVINLEQVMQVLFPNPL